MSELLQPSLSGDDRWEHFKETIRSLWKTHTLKNLMKVMEEHHDFHASETQYRDRLRDWGFKKYRRSEHWSAAAAIINRREQNNRESEVFLDGEPIPPEEVRRRASRYHMSTVERLTQASSPQIPPGFSIRTPQTSNDVASPTESGHKGRASIVALETPPGLDVNTSRQLQDSSPQHEEATPLSTEMLGFLSNLSPFPHTDAPHLSPDGRGQFLLQPLSPNEGYESQQVSNEEITERLLDIRRYHADGQDKEAADIWVELMLQIFSYADRSRVFNAMKLVFRAETLSVDTAQIRFEDVLRRRLIQHGIHHQLTCDVVMGYVNFLLSASDIEMNRDDWNETTVLHLLTKAESLLEDIIVAYFPEGVWQIWQIFMPQHIDGDFLPRTERSVRAGADTTLSDDQFFEETAKACVKEPLLICALAWTLRYSDLCRTFSVEKAMGSLIRMGLAIKTTDADGKRAFMLAPWLRPRDDNDGRMAFDVLDMPGNERLIETFRGVT